MVADAGKTIVPAEVNPDVWSMLATALRVRLAEAVRPETSSIDATANSY